MIDPIVLLFTVAAFAAGQGVAVFVHQKFIRPKDLQTGYQSAVADMALHVHQEESDKDYDIKHPWWDEKWYLTMNGSGWVFDNE